MKLSTPVVDLFVSLKLLTMGDRLARKLIRLHLALVALVLVSIILLVWVAPVGSLEFAIGLIGIAALVLVFLRKGLSDTLFPLHFGPILQARVTGWTTIKMKSGSVDIWVRPFGCLDDSTIKAPSGTQDFLTRGQVIWIALHPRDPDVAFPILHSVPYYRGILRWADVDPSRLEGKGA